MKKNCYIQVFDNFPDAVLIMDSRHILMGNSMSEEMLGWSNEELSKISVKEALESIISSKEKETYIEHKINSVLAGEKESFNALSQRKDKSIFHAKFTFIPFESEGQALTQIIIKDITERVIFEEAIRTSEERFKIFSSVVHNSAVFLFDDHIVDCNEQFVKLFEYHNKQDVLGTNISKYIEDIGYSKIRKTLDIEQSIITEIKSKTRKGNTVILEASINKINYQGQELDVLLFNDITSRKKTELILEQTTNRYKSLVENSPNGIFIVTEGLIKYSNSMGLNMLGYQLEDDVYDKSFIEMFSEDLRPSIENDLYEIRRGKELNSREIKILNKAGEEIDVSIKISLTVYSNQPSFQINIHNLTTRRLLMREQMKSELLEEINKILKKEIENHKKTQEQLKNIQDFTTNIFESSIDMIIAFDKESKVTEFNTAAQNSFGYSKQEAQELTLNDFFLSKDNQEEVAHMLRTTGRYHGEMKFKKKNGKKITTLLSASWIKNEEGKTLGSMGVLRDITNLKQAEVAAKKEQAKLDAVFNSTENMMIWIMTGKGDISSSNTNLNRYFKEVHGVDMTDGHNFLKEIKTCLNKNLYQKQLDEFKRAFKGNTHQFSLPLVDLEGNEKWMQIFINPISIGDEIEEISCLMFDVTERYIIERKVRDSLKEKEVLLKEVHHRVKNNLQVISSILNLQSGYVQDEQTLQILEESQTRIKAMSYIHETLYQTSDFSAIDFTDYMNTLVYNLIRSYTTVTDLDLDMKLDKIELALDHSIPCGLIVNELITNAMKYAYKGIEEPKMLVELKQKKNEISIRVKDNGVGLPKDFKYEQADSLGIQLVYTLVDQLMGNIEVNTDSGTEFLITFDQSLT